MRVNASQTPLAFRFDLDKFINALAYFASQGIRDLTKLKATKLLYLADRYHLFHFARPIIGDRYIAMDFGPVPEGAFQLLSRILEPAEVQDEARQRSLEILDVYRGWRRQYKYPVLRARRRPDLDTFSESEIEALAATVKEFGGRPASALVDLTHHHRAYKRADADRVPGSSVELPYEYFFEDAPADAQPVMALAKQEQEDRDFADALRGAGREVLGQQAIPRHR
jgi:uncharacterized phage-associated protein